MARQGYVNLLGTAAPRHADTASMVAARADFLGQGHYAPLVAPLARFLAECQVVVEAGAGTGYYLASSMPAGARAVATDISAYACRRAAKLPRVGAVVADTWRTLPLRPGCADGILVVFAPRNMPEFARILRPGGRLVVATPLPHHLATLRDDLGLLELQPDKQKALYAAAAPWFTPLETTEVGYRLHLSAEQVQLLVAMGPNAFHPEPRRHFADVTTEVGVRIDVFGVR